MVENAILDEVTVRRAVEQTPVTMCNIAIEIAVLDGPF
jgi:hypothetical protein